MKKRYRLKSPPYFLYLIIILLLFYSCYITNAYSDVMDKLKYRQEVYYVSTGDTLWDIGQQYKASGDNIQEWISKVKGLNNMKQSDLVAGTKIVILVDNFQEGSED